jgi:hypothetical protein
MADWKGRIGRATSISKISIADFDDRGLEGQPLVKYGSLILMTEDWKGNH